MWRAPTGSMGPSPRVRGAPPWRGGGAGRSGTIPARAGSTGPVGAPVGVDGDHPRACGEHGIDLQLRDLPGGPSPRVRGAPDLEHAAPHRLGTIPARAGSTRRPCRLNPPGRDHPRACGEHDGRVKPYVNVWGPSPRVRGARARAVHPLGWRGTIPARAGSTRRRTRPRLGRRDHPRACGEHPALRKTIGHALGPSPRVRGARPGHQAHHRRRGTIPARAGSTALRVHDPPTCRDHPRACGEHCT